MSSQVPKPFHCPDCGKEFSKEKNLISHFKVHSTEKSYKCDVCKVTFYSKAEFKNHQKTHVEKGNFPCPKCGKVFIRGPWLKRHIALQCDDSKQRENKFVCKVCGKTYDSLTGAKSHLAKGKHSDVMFKCHSCSWIATSSKNLFVHVLQHSNADVIIVGLTPDQHIDYYSTAKVRSKLAKYQPRPSKVSANQKEATSPNTAGDKEKFTNDPCASLNHQISQITNNDTIEAKSNETSLEYDSSIQQPIFLIQNRTSYSKDIPESHSGASKLLALDGNKGFSIEEENILGLQSGLHNGWTKAKLSKRESSLSESKLADNHSSGENVSNLESLSEKRASPKEKRSEVPKKMPKLVSLYPEEDTPSNSNENTASNSSSLLQNDILQSHKLPYKNFSPEISALMNNPLMLPFSNPLINTMFLPPFYILPLGAQPDQAATQPPVQMKSQMIEKAQIPEAASGTRQLPNTVYENHKLRGLVAHTGMTDISEDNRGQTNSKRRASKDGRDQQTGSDVIPENTTVQKPNQNAQKSYAIGVFSDNGSNKSGGLQLHGHLTESQERDLLFHNQREMINSRRKSKPFRVSENNLWDSLIENESSSVSSVCSVPSNNRKHLSLSDLLPNHNQSYISGEQEFFSNATITSEEKGHRKSFVLNKGNGAKGSMDVEDYIKKFMWF